MRLDYSKNYNLIAWSFSPCDTRPHRKFYLIQTFPLPLFLFTNTKDLRNLLIKKTITFFVSLSWLSNLCLKNSMMLRQWNLVDCFCFKMLVFLSNLKPLIFFYGCTFEVSFEFLRKFPQNNFKSNFSSPKILQIFLFIFQRTSTNVWNYCNFYIRRMSGFDTTTTIFIYFFLPHIFLRACQAKTWSNNFWNI